MKVVILAGGFGTRLSEHTHSIPKPMLKIGDKPIIWHIMRIYAYFGYTDFIIALGYKSEEIKKYFLEYKLLNSNFTLNIGTGKIISHDHEGIEWNVTLVDTGLETMTGGRVKRLEKYLDSKPFFLTYGDGLADINIKDLLNFHKNNKKIATLTSVRPSARFGELEINSDLVTSFEEKPQLQKGWINGGFFVFQPEIFSYINGDETMLEREPLESLVEKKQLNAFKHFGMWQSMDTKREYELLQKLWIDNKAFWLPN